MTILKFEKLGDNVESGIVASVNVKIGDKINKGDIVLELETEKAVIEVPSNLGGEVKKILVDKGKTIKPGDGYIEILESTSTAAVNKDEQKESVKQPEKIAEVKQEVKREPKIESKTESKESSPQSQEQDFIVPDMGDSGKGATLIKLLVKKGDMVEKDQPLAELETDKAAFEVPANFSGKINSIYFQEGNLINSGSKFLSYMSASPAKASTSSATPESKEIPVIKESVAVDSSASVAPSQTVSSGANTQSNTVAIQHSNDPASAFASPGVRRLAREIGVEITQVKGTGKQGRISIDDVKQYAKAILSGGSHGGAASFSNDLLPDFSQFGEIEIKAHNGIKKATAAAMSRSWRLIPMVTSYDKADITNLEIQRKAYKDQFAKLGLKLTATSFLIKFIALLLRDFPSFNASFDHNKNDLIIKKYINIGLAVDTANGLLVPVIKNADKKTIAEISLEVETLSKKAKDRKISPSDLAGSSFTISNLGGIGGTAFTPIVNWPEVAILGVSRSEIQPKFIDNKFEPRPIMPLSLSYDHRAIDGAEATRFLRKFVEVIEEPISLIMSLK